MTIITFYHLGDPGDIYTVVYDMVAYDVIRPTGPITNPYVYTPNYPPPSCQQTDNDGDGVSSCDDCNDSDNSKQYNCYSSIPDDLDRGAPDTCDPAFVSNPINIINGNKYEFQEDIRLPSPHHDQGGLIFSRAYNSQAAADSSIVGHGWTHNYAITLSDSPLTKTDSTTTPTTTITINALQVQDATGKAIYFTPVGGGYWAGTFNDKSFIVAEADGTTRSWYRQDGSKYHFNMQGRLTSLEDSFGNRQSLTYKTITLTDGTTREVIDTVTDDVTTRQLVFNYIPNSTLVESISGPASAAVSDGVLVRYGYDATDNLTSVTYADGSGFIYEYNDTNETAPKHHLTAKKDIQERSIASWQYDGQGRAFKATTRDDRDATITYPTAPNQTTKVADAYGVDRTYTIDKSTEGLFPKITEILGPGGCQSCLGDQPVGYTYDTSRRVSSATFGNGRQDTYANYDGNGNPQTVTLAANGNTFSPSTTPLTVNYTYHPILNVPMSRSIPSVLGPTGSFQETIWDYDTDGNDIPNEHPLNHNPLQRRIEKGYTKDATGTVSSFTHVTTYKYNAKGQVISIDGPLAADDTVRFEYDTKGNLTAIKPPLIGDITFSDYDAAGNPGHMTDQNGQVIALGYDAQNRLTSYAYQTNGIDGPKQTRTYIQGELTTITELTGRQLDYTYKLTNGLPDRITDQFGNYFKYGYDTRGNTISEEIYTQTDNRRKYQGYSFNEPLDPQYPNKHRVTGRLWQLINPDTTATIFGYDELGNINSMTTPLGKTTSYLYDLRGRLTQTTQPGAVTTKYEYNAHSNLTVVTDAKNRKTTYTYDDYGRLLSATSPDTKTTNYSYKGYYDKNDPDADTTPLTVTVTDAKGVTKELRYDVLGRLLTTKKSSDPTPATTLSYDDEVTNGKGRLHSAISPAGTFTYSYNDRGQLTQEDKAIDNVPYSTVYAYDETSTINLKSITYPSNLQVTYARNAAGQISDVQPPAGLLIPAIQASRNADGLITNIPITLPQTVLETVTYLPFGGAKNYTFANKFLNRSFDQRYLVTRIKSGTAMDYIYQHDANGNVTNIQGKSLAVSDTNTATMTYAANKNLLSTVTAATTTAYTYYLNGNIKSNGSQTFVYDQNNQLIRVNNGTTVVMDYTYDGLGRRTKKGTGTDATIYHYDQNGLLIGESRDDGTPLVDYIYLENECVAIMIYSGADSQPILYYVINDHLATPQMVVDSVGAIVWQADYTPYGEAVVRPGNTITFNLRFPGQYFDAETGLHYNWHRYYNPKIGRYLTPDPIGLKGGINLYLYSRANPISFIDPKGLSGWAIDAGGAYGTGWGESTNSSSGMAGTGVYIGATGPDNYAEIGGFTYQGAGNTQGAEAGLGYTLTRYKTDAKDFFQGTLDYKKVTFLGGSYLKYYDKCGNEVGWSIGIGGKGLGFSKGTGTVEGWQGALQ